MVAGVNCLSATGGTPMETIFWFIPPNKGQYLEAIGMIALRG
jgi:hypothetical protein